MLTFPASQLPERRLVSTNGLRSGRARVRAGQRPRGLPTAYGHKAEWVPGSRQNCGVAARVRGQDQNRALYLEGLLPSGEGPVTMQVSAGRPGPLPPSLGPSSRSPAKPPPGGPVSQLPTPPPTASLSVFFIYQSSKSS